jgi:hypothetical protein
VLELRFRVGSGDVQLTWCDRSDHLRLGFPRDDSFETMKLGVPPDV